VKIRTVVVLATAVALAFTVTGCGAIAEKAVEDTTGVDVEDDSVTITGPDDEQTTVTSGTDSLPEDFPEDFPVPDGDITSSSTITSGDTTEFYVTIDVDEEPKQAYDSLKSALEDDGYSITSDMFITDAEGDRGILGFEKGDQQGTAVVGKGENGGKATVTLMLAVGAS